jgi:hypothetical protein
MAKKQNVYGSLDLDVIKKEMEGIMQYLQSLIIETLADEIRWTSTSTGGMAPSIISTIEDKIKTSIIVLYDFVSQLEVIVKNEGISDFVIEHIDNIRLKMNEIQNYYLQREPSSLVHRYETIKVGENKKTGRDKIATIKCATKEQQIRTRSEVQKKILQILPKLGQLESLKKEIQIKGGTDIPPSLIGYI